MKNIPRVQKVLTPFSIPAPRENLKDFVSSFGKVLSTVFDHLLQSPISALEDALKFIKSNIVKKVCQRLDYILRINKSPISQHCLGPSKKQQSHGLRSNAYGGWSSLSLFIFRISLRCFQSTMYS